MHDQTEKKNPNVLIKEKRTKSTKLGRPKNWYTRVIPKKTKDYKFKTTKGEAIHHPFGQCILCSMGGMQNIKGINKCITVSSSI